jgi:hypothetical protein
MMPKIIFPRDEEPTRIPNEPIRKNEIIHSKDNQDRIFAAIEEHEGKRNLIVVPTLLIHMLGDLKAAAFLSQLIYWSDKGKRRDGYIYKSAKEWKAELGLSTSELTRVRKLASPFVEEKKIKANGAPTIHYRLRINVLIKAINEFHENGKMDFSETLNSDLRESDKSLTETTQTESSETTLRPPSLKDEEDWKHSDGWNSARAYPIQDRFMNICEIKEFNYGEKDEIKRIEHGMAESREHPGPGKHRYDPEFVHGILDWGFRRALDKKPITVKMLLAAINNDENFVKWSKPRKRLKSFNPHQGFGLNQATKFSLQQESIYD